MINVAIIEDNNTIREGLAALIKSEHEGYKCIGAFGDVESFLSKINLLQINVVLMDIGLPGMNGIEGAKSAIFRKSRFNYPDVNCL